MPSYQKNYKYTYTNNEHLKQHYGTEWPDKWQSNCLDTFAKKAKLLSDCCLGDYIKSNIIKFDLSKYGFKCIKSIYIHKNLSPILERVFTEIKEVKNYEIRVVYCHLFRYKKNTTTTKAIRDSSDYSQAKDWYCSKWKKTGDEKNAWWNAHWAEGAAEYDLKENKVKLSYLSNHSFGSAIDINPAENGIGAKTWDIPPKIVEIFRKYGFYWGGFYKDPMHFEYFLDYFIDFNSFSLPVDIGKGYTPTQESLNDYYVHNEQKHKGGYFPVGANTVWHGGVHIHAKAGTPVKAMARGTVIAARLAEEDTAKKHYGSTNFVLLEHLYKEKNYFCLYHHLNWEKLEKENKTLTNVPWLQKTNDDDSSSIDEDLLKKLKEGKVCAINRPVNAGDTIWTVGQFGSSAYRADMIHWEIFSESLMSGYWYQVVDKDTNHTCDNKKLVELIDEPGGVAFIKTRPDGNLSANEINNFFKNPQKCEPIRYYACQFYSEFAIDWDRAVGKLKARFSTENLASRIKPYNFWQEADSAGTDLPGNPIVWHYNPIAFIEQALCTSARARLTGEYFEADNSFLMNKAALHLNETCEYIRKKDQCAILFLGFVLSSDKTKDKAKLSEQRANSVSMVLQGLKDEWVNCFKEKIWGHRERQIILNTLEKSPGTPFYTKKIDGVNGDGQKQAVKDFQKKHGLKDDGDAGKKTLGQMFDVYYSGINRSDMSIAQTKMIGCSDSQKGLPSEHFADILVFSKSIFPDPEKYQTSPEKTFTVWQDSVDFNIEKTDINIAATMKFIFPADKLHKQYVNLTKGNDKPENGNELKVRVEVENPIEGQKIYWKVTADPNNSKRNDPKCGLKESETSDLIELNDRTAKCTTTLKNGEAEVILCCGLAGGDSFVVEAGVEDDKWIDKVQVITWRKLFYELQAPDFIELDNVMLNGTPENDYPSSTQSWIKTQLDTLFVEYKLKKTISFTKAESPAGTLYKPSYFGLPSTGRTDDWLYVYPGGGNPPKPFSANHKQTINVHVVDKAYSSNGIQTSVITPVISSLTAGKFTLDIHSLYPKKDLLSVDITNFQWETVLTTPHVTHPGYVSGTTTPLSGNNSGWAITNDYKDIIFTPPAHLAGLIGPESASQCPIEVSLKIKISYEINGNSSGNRQVLVFKNSHKDAMACTICHELGHNMGMTILSGKNPSPPGLHIPQNVDELLADGSGNYGYYYRHRSHAGETYGSNGVRGPNHTGGHCAFNIASRHNLTDMGGQNGTCIMYGEGGDVVTRTSYCPTCIEFLRGRNLSDIISAWSGRASMDC
ncbi:MAG: M15 family metallopeptidase [Proteobacteria bacterium]|nr:M15 family metallopeptidase [Pseudomonadota bacterium]